jgi:hypothetical protein
MNKSEFIAVVIYFLFFLGTGPYVSAKDYWHIDNNGGITWDVVSENIPHYDHIEMSGKRISVVFRYGVDDSGFFHINKSLVWPMLRTIPNDTHASLNRRYDYDLSQAVTAANVSLSEGKVVSLSIKGGLQVKRRLRVGSRGELAVNTKYFPSVEQPALIEIFEVTNIGNVNMELDVPEGGMVNKTECSCGVYGSYNVISRICGSGTYMIKPGDSVRFSAYIAGLKETEKDPDIDCYSEYIRRSELIGILTDHLSLESPDSVIDRMFAFSKIRACESIFRTKNGPLHSPGGESYYAAIWANDEAEYVNPLFPFVGYAYADSAALNSYMLFSKFMNDRWQSLPSSIIAEGDDVWDGAGDRGDAAMIAYGASRYLLARSSSSEAEKLIPLIKWCLEYCRRNLNEDGVVKSDCDELEKRFPAGSANLCTSSLYYDALLSAAFLNESICGKNSLTREYRKKAAILRKNIEKYFGADVEGYHTYRYYKDDHLLRSWICIPLVMGINERAEGTVNALFSDKLWTENGLLIRSGGHTYWDRETLYALRGALYVGATSEAITYLKDYSEKRLLGDHVPYAIEAWPEGGQRHLSAESGLYARIITEGLFGIRPSGFGKFDMTPHLPDLWPCMNLRNIFAFGKEFSIYISRNKEKKLNICLKDKNGNVIYSIICDNGHTIGINLK